MKFRYVGEALTTHHPGLGMLNHETEIEPSDEVVAAELAKDEDFVQVKNWTERTGPMKARARDRELERQKNLRASAHRKKG